MLAIPEKITIALVDNQNKAIHQENILVGIQTFATSKNNIELSPFSSNSNGVIEVSGKELLENAHKFIEGGVMDYSELTSAKPEVKIFVLSSEEVNRRIEHFRELLVKYKKNAKYLMATAGKQQIELLLTTIKNNKLKTERGLHMYISSYNKSHDLQSASINGVWDGSKQEYSYTLSI